METPTDTPVAASNGLESIDAPDPEVAAVFGNIIDRAERLEEQYAMDQLPIESSEQSPTKNVTFVKASLSLKIQSLPILDNLVSNIHRVFFLHQSTNHNLLVYSNFVTPRQVLVPRYNFICL